jgi:hypothetical protein
MGLFIAMLVIGGLIIWAALYVAGASFDALVRRADDVREDNQRRKQGQP